MNDKEALEIDQVKGIDLGHVVWEDQNLKPFVQKIITLMNSYTEILPLDIEIHILRKTKMLNRVEKKYVHFASNPTKLINSLLLVTFTLKQKKQLQELMT